MKISRSFRVTAALVVLGAALVACGSSNASSDASDSDLQPLKIGAPWNGTAGKEPTLTGPLGFALHQKIAQPILEKYGFRYDSFVAFNNGPPVAQALQSGSLQVGVIGDTPAVQARASGLDLPALVIARPTTDIWFLTRKGGVSRIEDLAGKKVGLQFGSNFDKYGRAVLERRGVLDQVKLVNLLFADALPALQRGEIDAVPLPASTAGIWRAKTPFPILSKASEDDPDLLATSVSLTSKSYLADHPKVAKAIWEATKAGQDAATKDRDGYVKFLADSTGAPASVIKAEQLFRSSTQPDDPTGLKTVESTLTFLKSTGTTKKGFDTQAWVSR